MNKKIYLLTATLAVASCFYFITIERAIADEEMIPVAASGDWVALAHHTSSISAPDMCVAVSVTKKAIIRADSDDIEFRVVNDGWSLPSHVTWHYRSCSWNTNRSI